MALIMALIASWWVGTCARRDCWGLTSSTQPVLSFAAWKLWSSLKAPRDPQLHKQTYEELCDTTKSLLETQKRH